jgi:hypothetical protein
VRAHVSCSSLLLLAAVTSFTLLALEGCGDDSETGGTDGGQSDGTIIGSEAGTTDGGSNEAGPPTGEAGTTPAMACTLLGEARCMALDQCSGGVLTTARWGSATVCKARIDAQCLQNLAATGTGATPATVLACAAALGTQSCSDVLANDTPEECAPVSGSLASFSPCFASGQCQTSFCQLEPNAACGLCKPVPEAGAPCSTTTDCGDGNTLGCVGMVCQPYLEAGAPCASGVTVCSPGYACTRNADAGASVDAGANCRLEGTTVNAACDTANSEHPSCNTTYGLQCVSSKCAAVAYVDAGQACGTELTDGVARCAASGTCVDGGVPTSKSGVCLAAAADNAPCDTAVGPGCLPQARCVLEAGTSGTCVSLGNASCGQ